MTSAYLPCGSCTANASSRFCCSVFILSSIVGYFVFSNASGTAIGDSPNINLNGVCILSACLLLLCVNSSVCKAWGHSSGCEAQYIDRYASISWLTHSIVPSVCGWYAVDNADLMPSNFRSSVNAFDANCGPQSKIILSRSPNCLYKFSRSRCAVSLEVSVLFQGSKITPFERPWSIMTKIELCPLMNMERKHPMENANWRDTTSIPLRLQRQSPASDHTSERGTKL